MTDIDSEEVDDDAFASSSKESDAAEEVAAARTYRWSIGRALCQIAVLEASAVAASSREGGVNIQGHPQWMCAQVNYSEGTQA